DGTFSGPMVGDMLRNLAVSGGIRPDEEVAVEGTTNWTKAAAVKGLFPLQTLGERDVPRSTGYPIESEKRPVDRLKTAEQIIAHVSRDGPKASSPVQT